MLQAADLEAALRRALPAEYHSVILSLAQALADASTGAESTQERLTATPGLAEALRALAGREVQTSHAVIAFGSGSQIGDVTISGDVAGTSIIKLTLNVDQKTINSGGGDYAEGSIDKRQGAFVSGGTVQGIVVGNNQGTVNASYYISTTPPIRSAQEQRNRKTMLAKLKAIWIDGFLNKSLTDELRIELNLIDRPDAVVLPVNALYQERDQKPQPLPAGTSIRDVFDRSGGELLILGAPGAGKTTLLLEILHDLLHRAERDEAHPIPIVFNLSTWATERKPLNEWLVDQINVIYDVPRKIGQRWVAENEVLPLLDGLDEVAAEHRGVCVEAINKYRQEVGGLVPTAVASRIADYEALKERLRLKGAVLIEPLTQQQVEEYLARVGEPLRAVRNLVESDQEVMELLDSPLMLSVVSLAFRDASPETLWAEGTVDERRGRLWEAYIERMFSRKAKETKYGLQQTMKWLLWLANHMVKRQETTFFIEQLQYNWLKSRRAQQWYTALDRYFAGLLHGLLFTLAFGLIFGYISVFGLIYGLVIGLSSSLFGGVSSIETLQQRNTKQTVLDILRGLATVALISVPLYGFANNDWLLGVLSGILAAGLTGMLFGLLTGKPNIYPRQVIITDEVYWSWRKAFRAGVGGMAGGLVVGLIFELAAPIYYIIELLVIGHDLVLVVPVVAHAVIDNWSIIIGLVYGFGAGLGGSLLGGFSGRKIAAYTRTNQGIKRTMRVALGYGLIGGLFGGFIFGLLQQVGLSISGNLYQPIHYGMSGGLIGLLALGGYSVQSHYLLRYLLYRQGSLPFRDLIPWLGHCVDRLFLRRVGGGYIFIHRLLMEHFAAMTDEDIARIVGEVDKKRGKR